MEKRRLQELESINRNPKSYNSTLLKYKINETTIKRNQSKEPTYITSSSDNNNDRNPIVEGEQLCKK